MLTIRMEHPSTSLNASTLDATFPLGDLPTITEVIIFGHAGFAVVRTDPTVLRLLVTHHAGRIITTGLTGMYAGIIQSEQAA